MPRYDYKCKRCENVEEIIHGFDIEHSFHCVECGKEMTKLISGVNIAPSAMPSRNSVIDLDATKKAEKAKDADMSAYKRLRESGVQPKSINGFNCVCGTSMPGNVICLGLTLFLFFLIFSSDIFLSNGVEGLVKYAII